MKNLLGAIAALALTGMTGAYGQQQADTARSEQRQQSDLYQHDAPGLRKLSDTTDTGADRSNYYDGTMNMQRKRKDSPPVDDSGAERDGDGAANMQPNSTSGTSATQYQTDQGTTGTGGQSDSGTDSDVGNMQPSNSDDEGSDASDRRQKRKHSNRIHEKDKDGQMDESSDPDN